MEIVKAGIEDLQEILKLQYIAYQSEAELLNDFTIPPLKETYGEILAEYDSGLILKAIEGNAIIGSVRAVLRGNTLHIGKLMVHPDQQNKGLGKRLLRLIEELYPQARYELFTSSKSIRNLRLYQNAGYVPFREEQINPTLRFIYLEKHPGR